MYACTECGHKIRKWLGRCPVCERFNTFEEDLDAPLTKKQKSKLQSNAEQNLKTLQEPASEERLFTNIKELDRVLSGGIVLGSLILLGGEPGVGKSTILLQICQNINKGPVLYVSGEESSGQIKSRAERLGITTSQLLILAKNNLNLVEEIIHKVKPILLIIDSIQTMTIEDSTPGSVTSIRECTNKLMEICKTKNIATILVGHVTKEGSLAGPKILEHMVDTVLYFEGEKSLDYRIIRATKNRFGQTNEIGIFKMEERGLVEIENPSEYMLSGRPINAPGSVITCTMEGTRPILAEVQALVSPTGFGIPKRSATGCDQNRAAMLLAVLEKKMNYKLSTFDAYINIAGGMKINEPALDAAIVLAIASSYKNIALDPHTIVFGEVGLAGEIRKVSQGVKRIREAKKLGFKTCIVPAGNGLEEEGISVMEVISIKRLLRVFNADKYIL